MRSNSIFCLFGLGFMSMTLAISSACAATPQRTAVSPDRATEGAESTVVEVSVLANGAKFIGDGTGGAEVVIRDASSGMELARGITRGGTGDTDLIMNDKGGRYENLVTEGAAVFRTELALERPRLVEVAVRGPLEHPIAEARASSQYWLFPGEDFAGDRRLVLTLSGYIIDVQEMAINQAGTGRVSVDLAMLCGCPIKPDGLWDANRILKRARLVNARGVSETVDLKYSGEGTVYIATFAGKAAQPRRLEIRISGEADNNASFAVIPILD